LFARQDFKGANFFLLDWLYNVNYPDRIPADIFKYAIIELAGIRAEPQFAIKFYDRYCRYDYPKDIELDALMLSLLKITLPAGEVEEVMTTFEKDWAKDLECFEGFVQTTASMYLEDMSL
jgi:hypothetical protein